MTTTVSLSFAALTIDSADPAALADFWGKALGRPVSPGAVAGDTAVDATGPDSGPRMILHHPPGPGTAKNSVHPVLVTDHHDEETERLTALGARLLHQIKLRLRRCHLAWRRSARPRSPTPKATSSTW